MTASVHEERSELWRLTFGKPYIDARSLAKAVEVEAQGTGELDYRTRLLIRDSLDALKARWSKCAFKNWFESSPARQMMSAICVESFERPGFPNIGRRLMDATKREDVITFLRALGSAARDPGQAYIGGASALILAGKLERQTIDVDFVNEIPIVLQRQPELVDQLDQISSLRPAHFQSHYLPEGWKERATSVGRFGALDVFAVDAIDVLVGKLFSARVKDLADVRTLAPQFDRNEIIARVQNSGKRLAADPALRAHAEKNWYIVFGDALPNV